MDNCREEEFEKFARWYALPLDKSEDGIYLALETQSAWVACQSWQAKVEELQKQKSLQELEVNQIAQANQVWQSKCQELQKRVEILEATLQSERWDKEAGFKIFFKARDMRGGWHGFERKPEYYEVGGYWMNGGKSIYLHGDEWCDRESAINSLASVKEQALKENEL